MKLKLLLTVFYFFQLLKLPMLGFFIERKLIDKITLFVDATKNFFQSVINDLFAIKLVSHHFRHYKVFQSNVV